MVAAVNFQPCKTNLVSCNNRSPCFADEGRSAGNEDGAELSNVSLNDLGYGVNVRCSVRIHTREMKVR